MRDSIEQAITRATEYLVDLQDVDGHWEEYALPVGASDAWVTAYFGLALHAVAAGKRNSRAGEAAYRAALWLRGHRPYSAGWGYNGCSGPDADSTAHALALLAAAGLPQEERDAAWLLERWQPEGGFATFDGPQGWGAAHPEIAAICYRVLPPHHQAGLRPNLLEYLQRTRRSDGSWPAYWWSTCFYSTFACLSLLRVLAPATPPCHLAGLQELGHICSAFDLALAIGIASFQDPAQRQPALVKGLLSHQNENGSWQGAATLRVTEWTCYPTPEEPKGKLYMDLRGLMSTATALSILTRLR